MRYNKEYLLPCEGSLMNEKLRDNHLCEMGYKK